MITVTINGGGYSSVIGNLMFRTSEDTLGMQVEFEILHRNIELAKIGDVVRLHENHIPFATCKVIEIDKSKKYRRFVTCFDYGFYLNKNEVIIQFKNIPADQAIAKLCSKFGIKHSITKLPQKINKIYKGENVSEVIRDILNYCTNITGTNYFFEMQDMTLVVAPRNAYEIQQPYTFLLDYSQTESMQEMKNAIQVVSSNDKSMKVFSSVEDSMSIANFGRLQKVEQIADDEVSKASKIARELLKSLNKITVDVSFSVIADAKLRANRIITILEESTGVYRKFYVKAAEHTVSDGKHVVALEVSAL